MSAIRCLAIYCPNTSKAFRHITNETCAERHETARAFLTIKSDGNDKYAQPDGRFVGKPGVATNVIFEGPTPRDATNPRYDSRSRPLQRSMIFVEPFSLLERMRQARSGCRLNTLQEGVEARSKGIGSAAWVGRNKCR
jgi:hypothetical protein